jgi:branched-chain amino acid transport system permease protein
LPSAPRPERLARPAGLLAVVAVVLLVVLPFGHRQALMLSLVGTVVCLSLVVIAGFVGQVSLAQVTLAGVSGFVVSHMIVNAGIGFPWGPLVGSFAAVAVGLVVGASALRVRGVSLAVVTLAGVVAIEQFGFANRRWGAGVSGSPVEQPTLFGLEIGSSASFRGVDGKVPSPMLGFVYLAVTIGLCLLVAQLRRSVLGQQMLAVRANERAAAATGINVARVKIIAYGISSFIAGTAGWMYAYNFGSVSAARFGFLIALGFVAFAYIGGITMVSGAVIGGLVATEGLVPHFFEDLLGISGNWTLLVGGLLLIVTLIQNPDGVAGNIYRKRRLKRKAAMADGNAAPRPVAARTAAVEP